MVANLFQKIGSQHEDFGINTETLHGSKVSNTLLVEFRRRHDLEDMEGGPGHIVSEHLEVYKF